MLCSVYTTIAGEYDGPGFCTPIGILLLILKNDAFSLSLCCVLVTFFYNINICHMSESYIYSIGIVL